MYAYIKKNNVCFYVYICLYGFYMFILVYMRLYMSIYVYICLYMCICFINVYIQFLYVHICL